MVHVYFLHPHRNGSANLAQLTSRLACLRQSMAHSTETSQSSDKTLNGGTLVVLLNRVNSRKEGDGKRLSRFSEKVKVDRRID